MTLFPSFARPPSCSTAHISPHQPLSRCLSPHPLHSSHPPRTQPPSCQVSEPNEEAVCATLSNGARAALAGYPTSLDQDLAELRAARAAAAGGGSSRKEAALLVGAEEGVEGWCCAVQRARGFKGLYTDVRGHAKG